MNGQESILIFSLRFTGLRISELLSLRLTDVDLASGTIHVRKSKTARGIRSVPIAPELRVRVQKWVATQRPPGDWFLTTSKGTAWTPQHAEKLVARVALRADVRDGNVTPHTLRRTFGSHLLNRGARLEVVSKLLGHSSTAITEECYAELLDETVREEFLKAVGA